MPTKPPAAVEACFFQCKSFLRAVCLRSFLMSGFHFRLAHNYLKKQCEAATYEVAYISDCISDCDLMQSAQWQVDSRC